MRLAEAIPGMVAEVIAEPGLFGGTPHTSHTSAKASNWRWVMLAILSVDICVSYLPYYTFVPILRQGMHVYNVHEQALNVLCILYAFAYVPCAFLTGPLVGRIGCRGALIMATTLITIGCAMRCPTLPFRGPATFPSNADASMESIAFASFPWLVCGQALCAFGQPFLVNLTSEVGAEWFPPHERPAAAMVSNLMNFIGSSLSFILPPMVVQDDLDSLVEMHTQLQSLLQLQLGFAVASLFVTVILYRPMPLLRHQSLHRYPVSFAAEVRGFMTLPDFWIVNAQFAIYVACCQSFDAVEGSLLEYYGYSASLTSKTGLACCVSAVISTLLESRCITSASSYRCALLLANCFMACSMLTAFLCLQFQLNENVFVLAVGIMGLSTPGWGCSCELSSEVCYPAREATVTSVLEAFSNLLGVVGIIATQHLIDEGIGASVLFVMAVGATFGGSLLFCLSGRLRRSSAESVELVDGEEGSVSGNSNEWQASQGCSSTSAFSAPACSSHSNLKASSQRLGLEGSAEVKNSRGCRILASLAGVSLLCTFRMFFNFQNDFKGGGFVVASAAKAQRSTRGRRNVTIAPPLPAVLANGLPEPRNVVISCNASAQYLRRFGRSMKRAGLDFNVSACVTGTVAEVEAAVREGLVPASAREAARDQSLPAGRVRAELMGKAIAHLRLMKSIENDSAAVLNVFQDDEVLHPKFRLRRNTLLGNLPEVPDFVNLNALRPAGDDVVFKKLHRSLVGSKVFKMREQLRPGTNVWLGNYVVTRTGARRILDIGRTYDTFGAWQSFDKYMLSTLYAAPRMGGFVGFAVQTNRLSMHCERTGNWLERSVCGMQ